MEGDMKVIILWTKSMEMVYITGQMVEFIMASGRMVNSMEKLSIKILKVP
jgi:hypothetical protein